MIQLRKNPFSETQIEIPFLEGETATELVNRALELNGYELSENVIGHFQVILNGHAVEKDMWSFCKIESFDTVLLAPRIARGEGGQMFKQLATIVITVAFAAWLGPAAYGVPGALAVAAVSIATTMALNGLIPPPSLGGTGLGGLSSSFEGSQMYTITSQANSAKKFGSVPRLYGSHRIFPLVAANPYTEIEAAEKTGTLSQFFYCIYDLGFGPLEVNSIKIGETPLSDYDEADYHLVDLNKPAVSEGPWDDSLQSDFTFYQGDVEKDGTLVVLNKDSSDPTAALGEYQTVRNSSPKVEDDEQEISVDFVCPEGLIAYAINGDTYTRTIELNIEFAKASEPAGSETWRAYNDLNYVHKFTASGGVTEYSNKTLLLPVDMTGIYDLYSTPLPYDKKSIGSSYYLRSSTLYTKGYPAGTTKILVMKGSGGTEIPPITNPGYALYFRDTFVGVVKSITAYTQNPSYCYFNLETPTATSLILSQVRVRTFSRRTGPESEDISVYDTVSILPYDRSVFSVRPATNSSAAISAKSTQQVYATFKFKPKEKVPYKIRVTRTRTGSKYFYRTQDKLTIASISTRFNRKPIVTNQRHVFLEVRVKATNQLNGAITNLSAVAESVLDVYDTNTNSWVKQRTNNPAWIFCDLLTGTLNKRALSKDRLHLPSILEWAAFCDEVPTAPPSQIFTDPRFTCNFVLDFDVTLQALINSVTNASQASLNVIDGKYGVLIDRLKTIPVQIFTPRNSSGFSSSRSYDQKFHALKIRYIDPLKNWETGEVIVYDAGYDETNAEEYDELSTFACTNHDQAWRFGRYMLAQSRLRKERITINVDFEYIVCTRGDFVQITQDVMRAGGRPARVKSVVGNRVTIDDAIDTLVGVSYGYVYRGVSGVKTSSCDVIDSDEFDLFGDIPEVGDLIVIGEVGKIVMDCMVKSISPSSDLTATLELVEKADAIYLAESTDTLTDYDPQITLNVDSTMATPPPLEYLIVTSNSWRVVGSAYQYYIGLAWDVTRGAAYDSFEVYVDSGRGYNLIDLTKKNDYEYIVSASDLNVPHFFKVLAVSSTGKKIPLFEAPVATATPVKKITPPSNVPSLFINITDQVIQLDWPEIFDTDLKEYLIRYSPRADIATWEASIPLLRVDKNATLAATQARTGTYFIKAVDLNGNESLLASQAITSIPNLFNLNIITETNDFPELDGERVTLDTDGQSLTLRPLVVGGFAINEYYPDGYYYYKDLLDLGEIYSVRLQSLIEAEGFTVGDLMSNWPDLSSISTLSFAGRADWDVETQYRTTDSLNSMSEWLPMSDVDPISEGEQDNWTAWKKFIMTDATGRVFQFRLKLISNLPSVSPRVFNGVIRADMPDRVESFNNQISTELGLELSYSPEFKGPGTTPNIQITQDNAQTGDYYVIENKTLAGFKITFYDKNDVAVIRQFDAAIKGYGRKALAVI